MWGWDEAFVGADTDDPESARPRASRQRCCDRTGLSCAVGIGDTRLQAKTATGFAKPGGVARLTRRDVAADDGRPAGRPRSGASAGAPRPGSATLGIATVAELARADVDVLARRFGPTIGPHLKMLGVGGDDSPIVDEPQVARSRSREETFERDLTDAAEIDEQVARLGREVTASVVAEGRRITHVAVKVRTATFFTRTKISKLPAPTTDADAVVDAAPLRCCRGSSSTARSACSACAWCWSCRPISGTGANWRAPVSSTQW